MNRRSFLLYTVAASVTAVGLRAENLYMPAKKPKVFTADLNSELRELNDSKIAENVVVVRMKEGNEPGSFIALSSKCTHRGCKVKFDKELNHFKCPCHKSEFGTDGEVVKGPAKKALQKYTVTIEGNTLTVKTDAGE